MQKWVTKQEGVTKKLALRGFDHQLAYYETKNRHEIFVPR